MRLIAYIVGFLILLAGLSWGALVLGAPKLYVEIGAVILLGLGIMMGAIRTRHYHNPSDVTVIRDQDHL